MSNNPYMITYLCVAVILKLIGFACCELVVITNTGQVGGGIGSVLVK